MKMLRSLSSLMVTQMLIVGCIGSAHHEKVNDSYSIMALDVKEDMALVYTNDEDYQFTIVDATVFAVGYDEEFIIVKQHPREFPNVPSKSITNYYVIPLKGKASESVEQNRIGPLTEFEFEEKRKELGIPESLTFSKVFDDLQ